MDPDLPSSKSDFYQTANLERLAASGMRFSNAYSASGVCSPTRAALLTGKSPAQLHYNDLFFNGSVRGFDGHPLAPPQVEKLSQDEVSIAQRVKQADSNYVTGLIGKWHVAGGSAIEFGYDFYDKVSVASQQDPRFVHSRTDAAINFMNESVANNQSFFLQVSHNAVHSPYLPSPQSRAKYEQLPPGEVHNNVAFGAYTEDLDNGVGRLLDYLDAQGLAENTYVIYASDNGAVDSVSNNNQLYSGKKSIFEGGVRTPLLISGPGIQGGSVSKTPVTTVDLYSTVSSLAGNSSALPQGVEGADLSPLLFNAGELPQGVDSLERAHAQDGAIFFLTPSNIGTTSSYRLRPMAAVRRGDYKLIRIFGENGAPTENLLFNLKQNPTETEFASSNLNLAGSQPDVTAELSDLLDNWIESADVSLPYDVKAPTSITWQGDHRGANAEVWRAVTDVDQKHRESWHISEQTKIGSHQAHQPGLAGEAIQFQGANQATRQFFHVSDKGNRKTSSQFPTGTPDFDRSASFEFWVRLDDLNEDHVLLATGTSGQGLSVTIGDADNDGQHDDARLRIAGPSGETLVATGSIGRFKDLTRDFVHLAVVFDDSAANRSAVIYANGHEVARTVGNQGENHSLYWDAFAQGFQAASLGGGLAQTPGSSDHEAFDDAWLRGEIAEFSFHNYALQPAEVATRYGAKLHRTWHGLTEVQGEIAANAPRPTSVASASYETDSTAIILHERTETLEQELLVDLLASSNGPGSIASGRDVSSYLIHYDPVGAPGEAQQVEGTISFSGRILGFLLETDSLNRTDSLLGAVGEYTTVDRAADFDGLDSLEVLPDGRTLTFSLSAVGDGLSQLRVLTTDGFAGDFNRDGSVDTADYAVWRSEVALLAAGLPGDGDGNGRVDDEDLAFLRANFGAEAPTPGNLHAADYNEDGIVDGADYAVWRNSLNAIRLQADADYDGDVDDDDLKFWREDYGGVDTFSFGGEPGDFNGDGLFNSADYAAWRNALATQDLMADADGDNDVDADDLAIWRDNFGSITTAVAAVAVPEPTSLVFCCFALLALGTHHRYHSSL